MKRYYVIIIIFIILVSMAICFYMCKDSMFDSDIIAKGNLLMADYNKDDVKGIKIYNLDKRTDD